MKYFFLTQLPSAGQICTRAHGKFYHFWNSTSVCGVLFLLSFRGYESNTDIKSYKNRAAWSVTYLLNRWQDGQWTTRYVKPIFAHFDSTLSGLSTLQILWNAQVQFSAVQKENNKTSRVNLKLESKRCYDWNRMLGVAVWMWPFPDPVGLPEIQNKISSLPPPPHCAWERFCVRPVHICLWGRRDSSNRSLKGSLSLRFNASSNSSLRQCIWIIRFAQDYSKFLDENFDVKEWVNTAFRSHKEGGKDVSITGQIRPSFALTQYCDINIQGNSIRNSNFTASYRLW